MASVTAVFVPAYCLTRDGSRLTVMSQTSAVEAKKILLAGQASQVIISTAYDVWVQEAALKKAILLAGGQIKDEMIEVVPAITDSFDEAEKIRQIVERLGIEKLIVVADRWQGPRAVMILKYKFPDLEIIYRPFQTPKYEYALEPHRLKWLGLIKGFRIGHAVTWIAWNKFMQLMTPLFLYLNHSRNTTHNPRKPSR